MKEAIKSWINTLILAVAVVMSVTIMANAFTDYKKSDGGGITITGSATRNFTSDLIVWGGDFSRKAETTKDAYRDLKEDAEKIKEYLINDSGVAESEVVFSSINITQNYRQEYVYTSDNPNDYKYFDVPDGYTLSQTVTIESKNVDSIESISRDITKLIDSGINFISHAPSYYYTQLDELKIEMIAQASDNAKQRAESVAKNSGSGVGELLEANLGVFQITAQNSSDEEFSYGGVFNTSSKNKTAAVTVKLHYKVKN